MLVVAILPPLLQARLLHLICIVDKTCTHLLLFEIILRKVERGKSRKTLARCTFRCARESTHIFVYLDIETIRLMTAIYAQPHYQIPSSNSCGCEWLRRWYKKNTCVSTLFKRMRRYTGIWRYERQYVCSSAFSPWARPTRTVAERRWRPGWARPYAVRAGRGGERWGRGRWGRWTHLA